MLDARELREAVRAGEHTGPTAGLAPGYTQANLVALPQADAFDFLRFCVQNPKPCPVLDVTDAGSPEPAQIGARRRPAHRRPALPGLARRRARRRADRRARALARRPRRLPDRLLVHLRARAARRGAADPPRRAGRQRADVPHRRRLHPGRALLRPAGRLDAADDAAAGDPRDPDHLPLRRRSTARRSTSATRPRSASPTSARPTTATPSRSATASCRCSGPAA